MDTGEVHRARRTDLLSMSLNGFSLDETLSDTLEDTKWVIRIPKKDRQHNGQKKKDKRTNINLQNIHIKLKIV